MRTPKTAKADVSFIRQETQFSCCAASIASALKAHGKSYTEDDVNKVLGASPMAGARWEEILSTVQYFGLRGTLVVPSTIAQLKAWTDAGIPVVIAWTPRDRPWAHASVVYNVDDTHVHVMDPNLPDPNQTSIVLTHEEFYSKWFEKFSDTVFVRRPAMAVEREVTVDGRQVMAGKKELRSMKDRGMSRHLKHGPVRPVDKSDTQSAMSKAQWEIRKEEGRAGLPGAGMGAGAHKDKSMYDRGEGKSVVREAANPTQPLMTRRDYGSLQMDLNEVEQTLKLAVNLPADVERYVKDVTEGNPDYTDEQVWATAWSIYCRANPESEHCHMNKSEYFPGRKAKFERGKSMTVDEVADVVGPEFKDMNEDPPESVKKVMEGMQGKKAHRSPLLAMEQFADMLKDSKFEKGKPADPTENMSDEDAAEWERQTEEHKDEFKAAGVPGRGDDENNAIVEQFFHKSAAMMAGGKYGFTKGTESACGVGVNKLQKAASRIAKALYAKDEGSPAFLAKHATRGGSKTASMILKAMESIGPMAALMKNGKTAGDDFYTKALANGWEELRGDAYAKASRITGADVDFAKKYGRKTVFARYHGTVTLYVVRDDGTIAQDWFMTLPNDGAIKEFVRVSLQEPLEKTAGKSGTGLYGFSEKTAKLGLDACTALHHEAGMIAGDLFARKGADPVKVAGYLAANAKKGKCAYSAMLSEVSPDIDAAVIAKHSASKKKPVKPDTDFEIEGEDGMWFVVGKPSEFVYSEHGSLSQAEKAHLDWMDTLPAQKMKKKKASDFLASVDDAEVDSNEEVLDIISKC